jgi:hypothetical protein
MDYSRLIKNISEVIKEGQIKLGYRKETIRLYYPLKSLNRFLQTDYDILQMQEALKGFCKEVEGQFGEVVITNEAERFCFRLSPQASEYIHVNMGDGGFIQDFVHTVSKHGITMDEVFAQFHKYSDCVHIEKVSHGEFDYLVYFEDGKPDDFRYCLTDEGCHIIYHRFTIEDYEDFCFEG